MAAALTKLAAAALTAAAASLTLAVAGAEPASAAECPGPTGVTVVVDHGSLGGGIEEVCSPSGGGRSATALLEGAGFRLDYVQRQPGFVCRINGQPASDPCVNTPPADAYWGLWWSDGRSGTWSYSSVSAGSLTVPDGGYVAFAWQSGSRSAPGVPATAHASPSPSAGGGPSSASPSTKPTTRPSSSHSARPSPSPTPSPSPSRTPSHTPSPSASAGSTSSSPQATTAPPDQTGSSSASGAGPSPGTSSPAAAGEATTPATAAATEDARASDPASSLPAWVGPAVVLALAVAAGAAYLLRRRPRSGP